MFGREQETLESEDDVQVKPPPKLQDVVTTIADANDEDFDVKNQAGLATTFEEKDEVDDDGDDDGDFKQTTEDVVARIDIMKAMNLPKDHSNTYTTVYTRSMQPCTFQTSVCLQKSKAPEWNFHFFVMVTPKCEDFLVCIHTETMTGEETIAKVRISRPVKQESRDFYGGWHAVDVEDNNDDNADFVRPKILVIFQELQVRGIERRLSGHKKELFQAAKHYLDPLEYSLLLVRVIEAKHLKKADWFGLSDPYVKISFSPDDAWPFRWQTKVIQQNLNPKWEESVYFLLAPAHDHFLIEVYDEDGRWKKDDFLGRVNFPLTREYTEHQSWRALDEGEGEILVRYINVPLSVVFDSPVEKQRIDQY